MSMAILFAWANAIRRIASAHAWQFLFSWSTLGMRPFFIVATSAFCLLAEIANAAPDAGAKAQGTYNFFGRSAQGSLSSARSHVESYQGYLRDTHAVSVPAHARTATEVPTAAVAVERPASATVVSDRAGEPTAHGEVDPTVAREASDAIGDDIERIQRHVARMRAHAEKLGNKEAIASLDNVDKQLSVARRSHASLHKHHAEDQIDPKTAMSLAQQVNDALRAAHSEHDKLMKALHETEASVGN